MILLYLFFNQIKFWNWNYIPHPAPSLNLNLILILIREDESIDTTKYYEMLKNAVSDTA
jgi:hypothetical protein